MSDDVLIRHDGPVAWVMLNRPEVGNSIRDETLRALCDALDQVIPDPAVKAIVLGGEGKNFMAGAEVSTLERISELPVSTVQTEVYAFAQGVVRRLYACPKPTVAALNGTVMTVGCEFVLACDFRVATARTRFHESWIRMGAMPPLGGLKTLPSLLGMARAKEIALLGRPIGGEEAVRIGLATRLVDEDDLHSATQALALELAELPPSAYREAKAGLHRGLDTPMDGVLETSALAQATLLTSDDFRARLRGLKEKLSAARQQRA